jgi:uncharacterized protein (DUF952 family)
MNDALIFKIATHQQWETAKAAGVFRGAPVDLADGYIHFSTAGQMEDAAALGDKLVYEVSRGGAPFPHLYAPLDLKHVLWVKPLPLDGSGVHVFPDMPE